MMGIETGGAECVPATEGGSLTAVLPTCAFLAVCARLGETREAGVFKPRSGSLFFLRIEHCVLTIDLWS